MTNNNSHTDIIYIDEYGNIVPVDALVDKRECVKYRRDDYAYSTMQEFEKYANTKVNASFELGWNMSRITNRHLELLGKGSSVPD